MLKKVSTLWLLTWAFSLNLFCQIPSGYYTDATGKSAAALKTALYQIIADHNTLSYSSLWEHMRTTDVRADGKVWDMYSAITNYTFGTDQAGNYSKEGDVYNREHSFPKSWFDDASPMYTDLFHLVPTDGYVNGRRSNYPFGETDNPTWTSAQGWSKLGPSSVGGYNGTVFEPNDEYKGDFARNYFYMSTAYEEQFPKFSSPMLAGNKYPAYQEWALVMLLRWAQEDPVSQKEIDRNNAVYKVQGNRNPYIDFPGLEQLVWGDKTQVPFDPSNYNEGTITPPAPEAPKAPTFSQPSGTIVAGTSITINCDSEGANICYTIGNTEEIIAPAPVEITIHETTTITAQSELNGVRSESVSCTYTIATTSQEGTSTYHKISSTADLEIGANYLVVCEKYNTALGSIGGNTSQDIRNAASITIETDKTIVTKTGDNELPYHLTLGGEEGAYTLYDPANAVYLSYSGSSNKLYASTTANDNSTKWEISINNGYVHIVPTNSSSRRIQYNVSAPRFVCYKGTQQEVSLYKQQKSTGIERVETGAAENSIYSIDGRQIYEKDRLNLKTTNLNKGVYIINGKKIIVK